jgi:nucleotide-binding universal stress UspA family protein
MYTKVLVPLDGSEIAECSLNHVKTLARYRAIGEVILLQVVAIDLPLREINGEDYLIGQGFDYNAFREALMQKSRKYLAGVQAKLSSEEINVIAVSIEANSPAQAITDYAVKNGVDMIVIATHGYTGIKSVLLGSVAFKVLHESHVPVLLIRPETCQP